MRAVSKRIGCEYVTVGDGPRVGSDNRDRGMLVTRYHTAFTSPCQRQVNERTNEILHWQQ